jgi:hypothetical protein
MTTTVRATVSSVAPLRARRGCAASFRALLALLLGAGACTQDPLTIRRGPEAGPGGDARSEGLLADLRSEGRADGGKQDTSCAKDPNGEVCNGRDDDCNGTTDDVPAAKLQDDLKNCGKCGNTCNLPNAFARCTAGACAVDACAPGYFDNNKVPADGCEYACILSNGGAESCDGADNNCDGKVDEGFDKQSDPDNCGLCGKKCGFANASATCAAGQCVMVSCATGFKDLDNDPSDGCEYHCPIWPTVASDGCDGVDNDCDGKVDEDFVPQACGQTGGECKQGTQSCANGYVVCVGAVGGKTETCNGKDDDCDGVADNGFDKLSDPRYCESCKGCTLPHAIANCTNGVCGIAVCEVGWVNLDGNPTNGCEYHCTPTGAEICDGLDNDCDGKTDQADSSFVPLGGNPCLQLGACAGATASCQGTSGWVCSYGPDVEKKACTTSADCSGGSCVGNQCANLVAPSETRCDGKDNNCNGLVDEPFPDRNKPCAEAGKKGICQGKGTWICNPGQTALACNITSPGQSPTNELCNGKDDDCDGLTDEEANDAAGLGVVDAMVYVATGGTPPSFYIYAYEASRPDASASSQGSQTARACSKPGVMPWSNLTYQEAVNACTAAGKRLCTAAEWNLACRGTSNNVYPYGGAYSASACNGLDKAIGAPAPTGSLAACQGGFSGIFDMSGNLREWTNDPRSDGSPPDPDGYTVRGGAYDNTAPGLRCDFTFAVMPPTFFFQNLGVRCCSSSPP